MIQDIVESYDGLVSDLQALAQALRHHQPPHWLLGAPQDTAMSKLCTAIQDLWYQPGQDGRETRTDIGLVALDADQYRLVETVNLRKQQLQQRIRDYRQHPAADWPALRGKLGQRHDDFRQHLVASGLARLHLKQCYRLLPLLPERPIKVGFSWYAHGRSIKHLTFEQAQQKLLDMGEYKPHIQAQLHTLGNLRPGTRLAQVQELAPIMRANLLYPDGRRKAMSVSLPLMFIDDGHGLPEFNDVASEPPSGRTRQARADQRLSSEPLLPSLRVYSYEGE
ncbi:DNA replication terminus site-binding protein [Bacterioplanes sanyensis]|uniref:DNA replication terminus site-binding protein n=1 Tax=Bacterioplanes sanyensis TaxID=1249553 RepID=A0A222FLX3_9GAMM|nr:hypothetical protein [Bacterioplanes sanyensis]ASP39759.1 DNA replication terminus site-binding protein [Bacterioplanes sanyensis]